MDIAEAATKMLVTKFSDKFFLELLPNIKENITENKDNESIVHSSFYMLQIAASEMSEKLISGFKEKIIRTVNENILTEFPSVRKTLANVVYELARKSDQYNTNKNFIYNLMKQARNKQSQEQINILGIAAELVNISKGEVLNLIVNEIFRKPYEEGFIDLASRISDTIADNIRDPVDLKDMYDRLQDAIQSLPEASVNAIVGITENLDESLLKGFVEFIDGIRLNIEVGRSKIEGLEIYLSQLIVKYLENTSQNLEDVGSTLIESSLSLLQFDDDTISKNVGTSIKLIVDKTDKENVDKYLASFMKKIEELELKYEIDKINGSEKLNAKFQLIMDDLLFLIQNGLLYSEDKILASTYVQKVIDNTSRQTMKVYIMKMIGPMIRILSEKFGADVKERILDNIKSLIIKCKEDIKGISPQLTSVFVKTLTDTSTPNSERAHLKAGENILRLLQYYPRPDVIVNELIKSISNSVEKEDVTTGIIQVEILSDIIRFYGHTLKPNILTEHYSKILNILNSKQDIPYDIFTILLSSYTKQHKDIKEIENIVSSTSIKEEMPRKLFNFMTIFNGSKDYFNANKKNVLKIIKQISKDEAVVLLKSLGKVVNKYKYFVDFDQKNLSELLKLYEESIVSIILDTDIFVPSKHITDANLCVFLLSLGYMESYETDPPVFQKVFNFLLALIEQGKVNSQLLVNCLSLLVLKEIRPNPDKDAIINALNSMDIEEAELQTIDDFLKKIYYLYG